MASNKEVATDLRSTAEHLGEQVTRFARLTALAAIPSVVNVVSGGHFDWKTLLAFILPFAEVAYRQVWPAVSPAALNSIFTAVGNITKAQAKPLRPVTGVVRPQAGTGAAVTAKKRAPAKKAPAKKTAVKKAAPPKS